MTVRDRLDPRKEKILAAIVEAYVRDSRPVGSASVLRMSGLSVSGATVRNEMRELEALGLLEQPHVSAGRVPTERGYRYYVDYLMKEHRLLGRWPRELIDSVGASGGIESALAATSKALSEITRQAAVVIGPYPEDDAVRDVHFSLVGSTSILMSVITMSGRAVLKTVRLGFNVSPWVLESAEAELRGLRASSLGGLPKAVGEVSARLSAQSNRRAGELAKFLAGVAASLEGSDAGDVPYFVGGTARAAESWPPEDSEGLGGLLKALEEQRSVVSTLKLLGESDRVGILIGSENSARLLRYCSVVAAGVVADSKVVGCVGVVGPVRMDYGRVVPAVRLASSWLSKRLVTSQGAV